MTTVQKIELDAGDLFNIWALETGYGVPWEHLSDRERTAWRKVVDCVMDGRLRIQDKPDSETRPGVPKQGRKKKLFQVK